VFWPFEPESGQSVELTREGQIGIPYEPRPSGDRRGTLAHGEGEAPAASADIVHHDEHVLADAERAAEEVRTVAAGDQRVDVLELGRVRARAASARRAAGRCVAAEYATLPRSPGDDQAVPLREAPAANERFERRLSDREVRAVRASENVIDESVGGDRAEATPRGVDEGLPGLFERHDRRRDGGHERDRHHEPGSRVAARSEG